MNEKLYKLFNEKNAFQRYVARRFFFNFFQRLGFHVTGNHFYELVPDTRVVAANYQDAPRALTGIDWRFAESEREALLLLQAHGAEYQAAAGKFGFHEENVYFRGGDALMLYVFLRDLKPAKMVEIGQGFSTRIALAALEKNAAETGVTCEFVSIDPYARLAEDQMPKGVALHLLKQELQSVDLNPLLENCDFLFVDSSHVYKFGSDVEYEFTRIYPQLRPGTRLHLHDIYSPYHYHLACIIHEKQFWNEQYMLENFLMFNSAFEVGLPMNFLFRESPAVLAAIRALPLHEKFRMECRSLYLRRK